MKIIYNKWIPFGKFGLINILGLVFSRKPEREITIAAKRHEQIHTYQQYEILMASAILSLILCNIYASWWYLLGVLIMPLLLYVLGFIVELCMPPYHNVAEKNIWALPSWISKVWMDAYNDNCFEREAYLNERDTNYHINRKLFGWIWYILKKEERQ